MGECTGKYYFFDDRLIPASEFSNNITGSGFAIYEVIREMDGVFLFLEDHYERLKNSAVQVDRNVGITLEELNAKLLILAKKNELPEGNVKVIVSFKNHQSHIHIFFIHHRYPGENDYKYGVPAMLFNLTRELPGIKKLQVDRSKLINQMVHDNEVAEAILVDNHQHITEGSKSNVFFLSENQVVTAPEEDVLAGITRKYVIQVCEENAISLVQRKINTSELSEFTSAFISGTSPKVLPLLSIDDFVYKVDHPLMKLIMDDYNEKINRYIRDKITF